MSYAYADNAASPELEAVEIHGMTRSAFILRGAVAAGGVYGAGMVTPFVRQAFAQGDMGDLEVLNFALTLEYLEAAFYKESAKIKGLSDEVSKAVETFGNQEQQHVDALTKTITDLGGKPVKAPMVDFGTLSSQSDFLKLAVAFEDTGVSAYNGAAPSIKSKEVLAAAGSIVQIEARHAAAIRLLAKQDPAPKAFDETLTTKQVLKAVKPYVKS
jgi:rubrerythrin